MDMDIECSSISFPIPGALFLIEYLIFTNTSVKWDTSSWDLFGFEKMWETGEGICSGQGPGMVLMPSLLAFSKSSHLCSKFGADMGVCGDSGMQNLMNNVLLMNNQKEGCVSGGGYRFWCGLTDQKENGVWLNVNNEEVLETERGWWLAGEPNGREQENCVETKLIVTENKNSSGWNDDSCENRNKCFFCYFKKRPEYTLRGLSLCHMEHFDYKYKWTNEIIDEKYVFRGYTGSLIYWNRSNKTWTVSGSFRKENQKLQLPNLREVYPVGLQTWDMPDDQCGHLSDQTSTKFLLNLSPCDPDSFNCNDGTCISIAKRCDLNIDCTDSSDEKNCTFLVKPTWYLTNVHPPKNKNQDFNHIKLELTLLNILDINIVRSRIATQFKMKMSWYDARLKFKNLKPCEHNNWVTNEEKIWTPILRFHNTESKATTISDSESWITIKRQGNFSYEDAGSLENRHNYVGSENEITQTRTYNINFICNYGLGNYPFDTQICFMNISLLRMEDQYTLHLEHSPDIKYVGPKELSEYIFHSAEVSNGSFEDKMKGVSIKIFLKRNILSQIMTIYVPTTLIMIVAYLTTFFNNRQWFGHIITINLTVSIINSIVYQSKTDCLGYVGVDHNVDKHSTGPAQDCRDKVYRCVDALQHDHPCHGDLPPHH